MNENIIEIKNLTRRFGDKVALDDVTVSVERGIVYGLVGENGAGKTTLIKHILGLLRAKTGRVEVFGMDPTADPAGVLVRIGYLSEDRDLPEWMRIDELLRYNEPFYPNWDMAYANELCEMFELDKSQKIKSLSRGQRARTGLLAALAHRPDLLLLDEPSSGLDPVVRRDILGAIIRTVAQEGRTVLFSSHLLDEVERVADHVTMMHCGKIVLSDSLDNVKRSHHRLTIRFDEPREELSELPGVISQTGGPAEWTIYCNGEVGQLQAALEADGGRIVEQASPSLDGIFVAKIKG